MKRRAFIKGSVAVSSITALSLRDLKSAAAENAPASQQEYYEIRAYRLKSGANRTALETHLETALIPALTRLGSKPVGVFEQQERSGPAAASEIRDPNTLLVLIPYPSIES